MKRINYKPRTCFIMTKLGAPIPRDISNMRKTLEKYLTARDIEAIDANSFITGKDFLIKILDLIVSVPLGIGIITKDLSSPTMSNIFYEIGLLQALGKEPLVIKTEDSEVPSDFVRTEYIDYDRTFKNKINKFIDKFFEQANHYDTMASHLDQNPLLAIDYLRRGYLITKDSEFKTKAQDIFSSSTFDRQTRDIFQNFLDS